MFPPDQAPALHNSEAVSFPSWNPPEIKDLDGDLLLPMDGIDESVLYVAAALGHSSYASCSAREDAACVMDMMCSSVDGWGRDTKEEATFAWGQGLPKYDKQMVPCRLCIACCCQHRIRGPAAPIIWRRKGLTAWKSSIPWKKHFWSEHCRGLGRKTAVSYSPVACFRSQPQL
jgi:hypothetical protein